MGSIDRIVGGIAEAAGMRGCRMFDQALVGREKLVGEVIKLADDRAVIQVFEDTSGLKIGEPVESTGRPLQAWLGPGLVGSVLDGIQRPLNKLGSLIERGERPQALDTKKKWDVRIVKKGEVRKGEVIAEAQETEAVVYKVLAPSGGTFEAKSGKYRLEDAIGTLKAGRKSRKITLLEKRSIHDRPEYARKITPTDRLVTGQRVLDTLFPVAKGGSAGLPGGFGSGKTVLTQTIAKWADADIVVMALVGERGNEAADVLTSFPKIVNKKTGGSIMDKSIIIANTSNMPVAARISSIYLAASIGEHYRQMGYNVLLIADSTSRWAEALREVSGKLEELPGEEGYPVYLASMLAAFYERAGLVENLDGSRGSLTIMGAVSPPGGDFSEPVTQATKGLVRCFWALEAELAYRRHYPAVDWLQSYSGYAEQLAASEGGGLEGHAGLRRQALRLLQREKELEKVVRLVGYDSLPDSEKFLLRVAGLFRENFLQQGAFHEVDGYCSLKKQHEMLKTFITFYDAGVVAIRHGRELAEVLDRRLIESMARMKFEKKEEFEELRKQIKDVLLGVKDVEERSEFMDMFREMR